MYVSADNMREEKGKQIANTEGCVIRMDDTHYMVKSQSHRGLYAVDETMIGWRCNCPDHTYRGMKCKHIWAAQISNGMRQQAKKNIILEPVIVDYCLVCHSKNVEKGGIRHNKSGAIQKYHCRECGKWFSINIGFEKMKHNPKAITAAMQLYFSGESLRNTEESLRLFGINVSHQTISNWIEKYTSIMRQYVDNIKPNVSQTWRADEVYVKIKGNMKYLFALMDDETRYWIAQEVADTKHIHDAQNIFHEAKEIAGKKPETLITDGLKAYHDAFNKEFFQNKSPRSQHINAIKLSGYGNTANNNKMERINGEIRDREKTMRGLKKKDTSILPGYQIFHNYIRPHEGLYGKTPAEACGIELKGDNKWLTLIQNASIKTKTN